MRLIRKNAIASETKLRNIKIQRWFKDHINRDSVICWKNNCIDVVFIFVLNRVIAAVMFAGWNYKMYISGSPNLSAASGRPYEVHPY